MKCVQHCENGFVGIMLLRATEHAVTSCQDRLEAGRGCTGDSSTPHGRQQATHRHGEAASHPIGVAAIHNVGQLGRSQILGERQSVCQGLPASHELETAVMTCVQYKQRTCTTLLR